MAATSSGAIAFPETEYGGMPMTLIRLITDDDGQDLIEYALLTAAIGLCALAAFSLWGAAISGTYGTLNTTTNGLWDPEPAP
jgi:Flp pilus assembly pilin Flp